MELTVRRAEEKDVDFLVWVMATAATSHLERCVWSTLCGLDERSTGELLRRVLQEGPPHWCHLDRFLVAEAGGEPVAAASRFDTATQGTDVVAEAVLTAAVELGLGESQIAETLDRAALLDAVTPKDYASSWGIENVAVRPEHRGRGAVEKLFTAAIEEGRQQGKEHAQILCLVGNHRAQRAWERNGFTERADYRSREFADVFGCGGMKLLVQEL